MKRALLVLLLLGVPARADTITVGLFAPSAPFPSTAARVELATRLGEHVGRALGMTGAGRVYARAGDFGGALKKSEVTVALVDSAFLAGTGGYSVVATTPPQEWQLVARGASKIGDLRGKRVLVPANGGQETDFVLNVLLGGEVPRSFFAKIEAAPDTAAALSALGLGKADAAVVPAGAELPAGTSVVIALPAIAGPALVVYGSMTPQQRALLGAALPSFKGDATIAALRPSDGGEGIRAILRRFSVAPKRGPFAVPGARLVVGDLVEGRTFAIERTPPAELVVVPK